MHSNNNKNPDKKMKLLILFVGTSYKRNKDFNKLKPAMEQGTIINTYLIDRNQSVAKLIMIDYNLLVRFVCLEQVLMV